MSDLNGIELAAMNNSLRRFVQRHWEHRTFDAMRRRAGIALEGSRILDAGCGSGFGLALLDEAYRPSRLVGIDGMPEQITRARAHGRVPAKADVRVGDITRIDEPEGSFDAVFVFGVLHHIPAWRDAVREFARVLTKGGVLFVEEIQGSAIRFSDRVFRTSHPREAAFSWPTFRSGLRSAGFKILEERPLFGPAACSFLARSAGAFA